MAFPQTLVDERTQRSDELLADFKQQGVKFAQMEMFDFNGTGRGKVVPAKKALSATGSAISTLVMAARSLDHLSDTPFTSLENGYPKMVMLPDYDTLRVLPWRNGMASIMCDFHMDDGTPCPLDPRHLLKRADAALSKLGYTAKAAVEFECYIFERDQTLLAQGKYDQLTPFGRNRDFYSLTRAPHFEDLAIDFISRMDALGVEVEAFHTEYGAGMFEFALGVKPVLEAADDASRARLYLKQLCIEHGLVAVFMPQMSLQEEDNACGAHHNLSFWKDGKNAVWDPARQGLSDVANQFAAGMLETAPDFHALFKPWINSYRRMDKHAFSPENASWAYDNHSVAIRVVHGSWPEKYARFEHRLAATDVNFHLTLAALLLGGLHGIENRLQPPPYGEGDVSTDDRFVPLTKTLREAVDALDQSELARQLLGAELVEQFCSIRRDECKDFEDWTKKQNNDKQSVTQWELQHYFEWI